MPKRPKFKTEAEEADWYYRNRNKINWQPVRDENGKLMTPAEIIEALRKPSAERPPSLHSRR